jgi:hypothetical protein
MIKVCQLYYPPNNHHILVIWIPAQICPEQIYINSKSNGQDSPECIHAGLTIVDNVIEVLHSKLLYCKKSAPPLIAIGIYTSAFTPSPVGECWDEGK